MDKEAPRIDGVITDASPKECGAILVKVIPGERRQLPVEAVEGLKSETEAKLLKVEFGESSSQAEIGRAHV